MAMDIYDSQYLLVLAPSLVIALMFLFFWLFMKETSYDEVLARQKRDLKLPPSRPDTRKKGDKKKNKKRDASGGGGGGGESEEDLRDFEVGDTANGSALEEEEEPEPVAPPTPAPAPLAAPVEPPSGLKERKKKEKKQQAAAAKAAAGAASAPEEPEVNGSKAAGRRAETPVAVSKQHSPTPPQPDEHAQTPPQPSGKKEKKKKQKAEAVEESQPETKVAPAPTPAPTPAPAKKEAPIVAETKAQDGAPPPTTTTGKKKNSAKKQKTEHAPVDDAQTDSAAPTNHQAGQNDDASSKGSGRKQKMEADKENSEVKLKELLAGLGGLTEAEVVSVVAVLREKSPNALEAWHKSTVKADPSAQEKDRLLNTLQEEASIAKDKVKQLSQELQLEKQKSVRAEALVREHRGALEKEMNVMQAKAQGSYQDMQMKFQQVREQLDSQISRLQQENKILRDAVSSATNQMENKQSAELNNLRSEYSGLMKELAESSSKLQQEEHQRKSLEVNYKQLEAQLQDTKRRWDELQNYLHGVNSDKQALQAAKQELQNQLLAVETEMNNKNQEIQTLHSSLTDTMVSKEQMEQKVLQLLETSQHRVPDDALQGQLQELLSENKGLQVQVEALQAQVSSQAAHVSHFEELQKLLAEKEQQRKSLEDSLNAERSSGASRETNMQGMHNENLSLKADLQNLQAQISDQTASHLAFDQFQKSVQEREENIKTVEDLLKAGLIEVANKEEELKAVRVESEALKQELEALRLQIPEQSSSDSIVDELQSKMQEREDQIQVLEDSLQTALDSNSTRQKAVEALEQQVAALQSEAEQLKQQQAEESSSTSSRDLELQAQLASREQEVQSLQAELEGRARELEGRARELEGRAGELEGRAGELEGRARELEGRAREMSDKEEQLQQQLQLQVQQQQQQESQTKAPSSEMLIALAEREKQVSGLQADLEEREKQVSGLQADLEEREKQVSGLQADLEEREKQVSGLQADLEELRDSLELHRKKNNELREKNWSAMEALSATETMLQGKLSKTAKESQTGLDSAQAECREVLHRLLPHVPLPTQQDHQEWLQRFESAASEVPAAEATPAPAAEEFTGLADKLKESEEAQQVLQKDCETYKKVLAETEGILQRLQNSVEQEESRWKVKLELGQVELKEMSVKVTTLEQEVERLGDVGELENVRRDKQHLEAELERAERESATYVMEVRELKDLLTELQSKLDGSYTEAVRQNEELTLLKTQLTETLSKLEAEESERQKVAGDLYKAQQSLDLIQEEIFKETGQGDLIENDNFSSQREEIDRKEKVTAGLNQTVRDLQHLLQSVNRQLTKRHEGETDKDSPEL
ncbi:kinectin isoform X2 [Osmerus eperlanus]|uniref:kinectin isoform X2 n=1 Tax=Osmerus eperlanus TaxID=29151 RepID=UPI002E12C559